MVLTCQIQVIQTAIEIFPHKKLSDTDCLMFHWQDEEEEEVLVDISTSPEPKLGKLASASGNGSSMAIKPAVAIAKKIVLNRSVVATTGSSEKENQQQHQTTQAIADTEHDQQQSEGKKVIKLSAFSMKQVGEAFIQKE
jgi:hypothetical protein